MDCKWDGRGGQWESGKTKGGGLEGRSGDNRGGGIIYGQRSGGAEGQRRVKSSVNLGKSFLC